MQDTSNAQSDIHDENTEASAESAAADSDKKIQELEAQVKEKSDKYLYLYAEFENYKKRAIRERSDSIKFGWENIARELILVLDNFERAIGHMPATTDKNLAEGIKMIASQYRTTLTKQGVTQLETLGKEFNPELHEAIAQVPSDKPAGVVIREELPGYTLHGRLLRPANVILSTGAAGPVAN